MKSEATQPRLFSARYYFSQKPGAQVRGGENPNLNSAAVVERATRITQLLQPALERGTKRKYRGHRRDRGKNAAALRTAKNFVTFSQSAGYPAAPIRSRCFVLFPPLRVISRQPVSFVDPVQPRCSLLSLDSRMAKIFRASDDRAAAVVLSTAIVRFFR